MFKRFISTLGSFITIADIFGYILVSIIACSLWLGYQKAGNIASNTAKIARNRIELEQKVRFKLNEMKEATAHTSPQPENKNSEVKPESLTTGFNSYLGKIKDTLGIFNIKNAKETVGSINASVNGVLSEVTTEIAEDPRKVNFGKGTPKVRDPHHRAEVEDSLAPF